jgi:hypothetical protein
MASPQPLFFGADNVKSGGFLDRFDRHLNRVPNAGRTRKADRARPKAPRRVQPITFAFCSLMRLSQRYSVLNRKQPDASGLLYGSAVEARVVAARRETAFGIRNRTSGARPKSTNLTIRFECTAELAAERSEAAAACTSPRAGSRLTSAIRSAGSRTSTP